MSWVVLVVLVVYSRPAWAGDALLVPELVPVTICCLESKLCTFFFFGLAAALQLSWSPLPLPPSALLSRGVDTISFAEVQKGPVGRPMEAGVR